MTVGSLNHSFAESLIRLQSELEYALDAGGFLVPFPHSMEQARFIIYHHSGGYARYYRHDLPLSVCERLAALPGAQAFATPDAVRAILRAPARTEAPGKCEACTRAGTSRRVTESLVPTSEPRQDVFIGTSGVVVAPPDPGEFPDVVEFEGRFVILSGDEPVAEAFSVRENPSAAEAAVETGARFRRRGYGRQVTAAWAHHVLGQGKVAFYSHQRTNLASEALARSLGVVEFATVAGYE